MFNYCFSRWGRTKNIVVSCNIPEIFGSVGREKNFLAKCAARTVEVQGSV